MDNALLDILACPACKGSVHFNKKTLELICPACRLAYPVRDDIPVMLTDQARQMTAEEEI